MYTETDGLKYAIHEVYAIDEKVPQVQKFLYTQEINNSTLTEVPQTTPQPKNCEKIIIQYIQLTTLLSWVRS